MAADTPATSHPPKTVLVRVAVTLFVAGLICVAAVLVLFALGHTNLPSLLNVAAVALTSVGFGLGLVALFREARSR